MVFEKLTQFESGKDFLSKGRGRDRVREAAVFGKGHRKCHECVNLHAHCTPGFELFQKIWALFAQIFLVRRAKLNKFFGASWLFGGY